MSATTANDIKDSVLYAVEHPLMENVRKAIIAMRSNPPASAQTMRAMPKDKADQFASLLNQFWASGRKL
jgi:hypothetical protein